MQNDLAFLYGFAGIPLVGNESMPKIFGEASSDIILSNMVAVKIDAGKMRLSVLIPSDYEIIIIWVLFVSLLVANFG